MAVNILSQEPPQLHDNLISTTETGKDDDRLSPVHIVEPSEDMSTRVYVGNLGYDVDDRDLYYFFYQFGPVEHARVIVNRNGFSKGYGFVTFHGQEFAKIVIEVAKRDRIWMNGRMLRVGAARKSNWAREVGLGHAKRRLHDKDSDKKVYKNDDTSDTLPTEYQPLTNDDGSSVDVGTASYQLYCYPTKTASYPVYYPPPYPQISGQDMPYYPTPWHNMSYTPTRSYTVPIPPLAPIDSSYQYRGAVLTEQPTEAYWEHQDSNMYMVTYDNTQCGNSNVEYLTHTENHQDGFQCPDVSNGDNIQTYQQLEWGTGVRTDYMDTHMYENTEDSYLCDSGFQESVLEIKEFKGQVAVSIDHDEVDYENRRGGMEGKHESKTDPFLKEESRDNVGRSNIGEVPIENYQNSKGGWGSTLKKNSPGKETADCRKIMNNGGTEREGPCLDSTPDMVQFQSSLEKLEIK